MPSAVEKAARHQVIYREVNERIAALSGLLNRTGVHLLICECSNPECAGSLEITQEEYEAVRAHPARFVVLRDHETPTVERVIVGNSRYLVVEKFGAAGEIAAARNPRRRRAAPVATTAALPAPPARVRAEVEARFGRAPAAG